MGVASGGRLLVGVIRGLVFLVQNLHEPFTHEVWLLCCPVILLQVLHCGQQTDHTGYCNVTKATNRPDIFFLYSMSNLGNQQIICVIVNVTVTTCTTWVVHVTMATDHTGYYTHSHGNQQTAFWCVFCMACVPTDHMSYCTCYCGNIPCMGSWTCY